LYDAVGDCGYWLSIHDYFGDAQAFTRLHGKTITIPIPKENTDGVQGLREFAREKAAIRGPGGSSHEND
jgi:hypothetical protein